MLLWLLQLKIEGVATVEDYISEQDWSSIIN
jgi:hypothetical protein